MSQIIRTPTNLPAELEVDDEGIPILPPYDMNQLFKDIAAGDMTTNEACKRAGMTAFKLWYLRARNPQIEAAYITALEIGGDNMQKRALEYAMKCSNESWGADRLRVDTLKWVASRQYKRVYGNDSKGVAIQVNQNNTIAIGDLISEKTRRRSASTLTIEGEAIDMSPNDTTEGA